MGQEQKDVLKMLADGIISVDEAERLLKALDFGKKKDSFHDRTEQGINNFKETLKESLQGLGGFINDVIHHTEVEDLGFDWTNLYGPGEKPDRESKKSFLKENLHEAEKEDMSLFIPENTKIVISCTAGGNITLDENIEGLIKWSGASERPVRYIRKNSRFVLLIPAGDFKISLPSGSEYLKVSSMGGSILSSGLSVKARYKTMGGTIKIDSPAGEFAALTMGGSVLAQLSENFKSRGKIKTHGGCITLKYPENLYFRVEAQTMAGRVDVPPEIKLESKKQAFALSSVKGIFGKPDNKGTAGTDTKCPEIKLKTMAGDIYMSKNRAEK
jgi:hypothetical protein